MPYIDKRRREKFDEAIENLAREILFVSNPNDITASDGDMNYVITRLIHEVFDLKKNPKYHKFNAAIGVLECAKLEMYRRLTGPYEDVKIKENGDV